jgi:hypothetical protein
MTSIAVDQRGCGLGKTTVGIYTQIRNNMLSGDHTMVVVPSILLQNEYQRHFTTARIINNTMGNTTDLVTDAMRRNDSLVIITHAAFYRIQSTGYRNNYHLIIDEALEAVIKYNFIDHEEERDRFHLNWQEIFGIDSYTTQLFALNNSNTDWHRLTLLATPDHVILNASNVFKELIDPNYIHHTTQLGYANMRARVNKTEFCAELDPHLLSGWNHVHIASGAFMYTKMAAWMSHHQLAYTILTDFVPHTGDIHLYTTHDPKFSWSNSKRMTKPTIIRDYHKCVDKMRTGTIISLRNNGETSRMSNEILVSHNVHGLNTPELQVCHDISVESALRPVPTIYSFITKCWLVHQNKTEHRKSLNHMFMAHLFYQVIMRSALRSRTYNNERVNIFCIDQNTAVNLMAYFDVVDSHEMEFLDSIAVAPVNYKKKQSGAERQRKYMEKKRAMNSK